MTLMFHGIIHSILTHFIAQVAGSKLDGIHFVESKSEKIFIVYFMLIV